MAGGRGQEPRSCRQPCLALATLLHWGLRVTWAASASHGFYSALINVTVQEPGQGSPHTFLIHDARYGVDSPKLEVKGWLLVPQPGRREASNLQGCDPETHFQVPADLKQWIALFQRGNCTFKEKISRAAFYHAVAAVIYNNDEKVITMSHPGTENIVAVMIKESEGKDILSYLEKNISVQMTIFPATSVPSGQAKIFEWNPVLFLSISFFALAFLSLMYLISNNI